MKKLINIVSLFLILPVLVFADMRIGILNGPSCVPCAYIMENIVSVNDEDVNFTRYADAMTLVPKILKDEIDIGFLPVNVAAKIYNSTNKMIIAAAVVGEGNLSLITKDDTVSSIEELKGKTVYVAGEGATPDFMFKYLLESNGLNYSDYIDTVSPDQESVQISFSIPTAQISSQLISNKISYAVVPEPFSTIAADADASVVKAIDFQKEYQKISDSENYPLTVLVVSRKFAENKNEALNSFLEIYKEAVQFTVENPAAIGELCQRMDLGLKAKIVEKSVPKANYVYIPANQAKAEIENLLNIFIKNNPSSIGEKLPDEDFYY